MLILASETAIIISFPTGHHLQMQTTFAKIFDQYDQELPTPIHVDLLAKYLSGYDKTEKEYILQGFSKGFTVFSAISDTQVQCRNLQSALLRPGIVAEKIQTELAAGRFAGSFDHPLFQNFMFLLWAYVRKKNQISLEYSTIFLIRKGALLMILYHQNILQCKIVGFRMQFRP